MTSEYNLSHRLTIPELVSAAKRQRQLHVPEELSQKLTKGHEFLLSRIEAGETVYGVTTGFGPMVNYHLSAEDTEDLQFDLLQQLNTHTGRILSAEVSRAIVTVRARALSRGVSGVRGATVETLAAWQKSGCTPIFQTQGSVGASGDLVPLARLARVMNGRDSLMDPGGQMYSNSEDFLHQHGLPLWSPAPKEALAVVNGTSYSAALSSMACAQIRHWLDHMIMPSMATFYRVMEEPVQHLSSTIYHYKDHKSARSVAGDLRSWLELAEPERENGADQTPYSSRSAVLWLGAVRELLDQAEHLLTTEINSVDDNPLILPEEELFLHGANFQGSYAAMAADHLSNALVRAVILIERIVNRLLHDRLNGNLPPFLAGRPVGKKSGLQGYQLMISSVLADLRARSTPHGLQSVPTNADNQDIVSMSANAAGNLLDMVDKAAPAIALLPVILARTMQLKSVALPDNLSNWWGQFPELTEAEFEADHLASILTNHTTRQQLFPLFADYERTVYKS